jgi:hypothetical protein
MLNWNEPVTHLFLDEDADGRHYQVTVPVRIAEEIGCVPARCGHVGIDTLRQLLNAIETRGELAEFEVIRIDGAELRAWKELKAEVGFGVQR